MTAHRIRYFPLPPPQRVKFTFNRGDTISVDYIPKGLVGSILSHTTIRMIGNDLLVVFDQLHLEMTLQNFRPIAEATGGQLDMMLNGTKFSFTPLIAANLNPGGTNAGDGLYGNDWSNKISGRGGDDFIVARDGNDSVWGGAGSDEISGNDGNDRIWGGTGNDTIEGGSGRDIIAGEDGNDFLAGEGGNDVLWGGRGNDTLVAWSGNDVLSDGAYVVNGKVDHDVFLIAPTPYESGLAAPFGNVTIKGFSSVNDVLKLPEDWRNSARFVDVSLPGAPFSTKVLVDLADGRHTITVLGTPAAILQASIVYY